jgi:hypothetical protein
MKRSNIELRHLRHVVSTRVTRTLGRAGMMTFQYIPMGPLWPLGLLLREPTN